MLKTWWKIIKTAVWVVGGLLSFFFLIEILRTFQTLYNFHPVAAYGFVVALVAVTLWVFWYFFAAMDRCRAYRPWNEQEAKDSLRKRAADFYADVKDTFWVDIWPSITSRVGEASAEMKDKIASALDETQNAVGSFVKVPLSAAVSAGSTVVSAGGKAASFSFKGITKVTKIFHRNKTKDKT